VPGLGTDADLAVQLLLQAVAQVEDLGERRDLEPAVEGGVLPAEVKSSVNQPVNAVPSIVFVVLRAANSGCSATSVVPLISGSCRVTSTPSEVITRSGSMWSAPIRAAGS
jgi:hypothetical protein